jgi:hypothetical protein
MKRGQGKRENNQNNTLKYDPSWEGILLVTMVMTGDDIIEI